MAYLTATTNSILTPTVIAKEALMLLTNNLVMGKLVHREYKNEFKKVGTSIQIRKPVKATRQSGTATASPTDLAEYHETFSVATQDNVSWQFSSVELTMEIEEYSKRYIAPNIAQLANGIDYALTGLYDDIAQSVGTPGVTPATYAALGAAQQKLDEAGAPNDSRFAVVNPAAHWALADGLKGTFAATPANDIHTKGLLGSVAGLDIHMDQNIRAHTTGYFDTGATPLVDQGAACVEGDFDLGIKGLPAGTEDIEAGDVFTVAAVYAVNPMNQSTTGTLYQFVNLNTEATSTNTITADVFVTTGPGMRATGPYTNMTALPVDGAAVTFMGSETTAYSQNMVFHPNAFGLVMMPLAMPSGVWGARATDTQMGVSVRVTKFWDGLIDQEACRLDVLYGVGTLYPELACRLWGA